ncbi:MAG: D-tyrosyl-tRNA(Tyr) deacylase [Bacteroidia bacterium]|nr:D-tyrosyl-tRNA(Tyr) deacylase [Bacteroidia bacterium]NNJ55301.1 D-tyrosyl-tRNA(Tyr) deacylase [Bacteroidia bacterium]
MKVVLQRVSEAQLLVNDEQYSVIGIGLVILLGIEESDGIEDINWLVKKIVNMRIFADKEGKMNLSLLDVEGELLVVSQFTLHASTKKGNRPSFIKAAKPAIAIPLYEEFIKRSKIHCTTKTGVFGADMKIELINDGPVTIILDSQNRV